MGENALPIPCLALGGEDDLVPHVGEGETDFHFTVRIGVGGVEIVDAALAGRTEQLHGVIHITALHGETAHSSFGHHETGIAKGNFFHIAPSLEKN